MNSGQSLAGRAVVNRAKQVVSALRASIPIAALALAGCGGEPISDEVDATEQAVRGLLRARLNEQCMADLPAGPKSTHYNDWDEVVGECSNEAYYQANGCVDPLLCLRVMFPDDAKAIEAGTAKTERLGPTDESAVGKADLPNNSGL